jgi:hypothetical protein
VLQTAAAAVQLGLNVATSYAIAPLINHARTLPAGDMVLSHDSVRQADVSGIVSLPVFRGFSSNTDSIYGTGKSGTAEDFAQRCAAAVALLVVMLRRLALDHALCIEVRAALLPDFGVCPKRTQWYSLNRKMHEKWDERQLGQLLERVAGGELQSVKFKYTRVAAMQMLALLMQQGYVVG